MRWKNPKSGVKLPWKRIFALVPVEIEDEWFWFEWVYRRSITYNKTKSGRVWVEWGYEYASPDAVLDALKGPAKRGMNIDA
jgi:hypothetical protein